MLKRYLFYLIRWQLSTPILTLVLTWLSDMDTLLATIIVLFLKPWHAARFGKSVKTLNAPTAGKQDVGTAWPNGLDITGFRIKTLNLDARNAANASWRR